MKRSVFVLFFVLLAVPVFAQDFPKVEVFGGYSLMRADVPIEDLEISEGDIYIPELGDFATISNLDTSKFLKKGFTGSFTYNITSAVGIEANFRYVKDDIVNFDLTYQGQTVSAGIKLRDIALGAGPKFTYRNSSPLTPFAHALVGFDDVKLNASASFAGNSIDEEVDSHTGFGLTLGGGLDVSISEIITIRLIQADYYMSNHFEDTQNNFLLSFGVVFGLGK